MIGDWNFIETADCADTGVVDPNVDSPEFRNSAVRQPLHIVWLAHIGSDDERGSAGGSRLASDFIENFSAPRCNHHVRVQCGQLQGDTTTESTRRARNDECLAGHTLFLVRCQAGSAGTAGKLK